MEASDKINIDPVLNGIARVEDALADMLQHSSHLLGDLKTAKYFYEIGDKAELYRKVNALQRTQGKLKEIKEDADKGIKALQDAIDHLEEAHDE